MNDKGCELVLYEDALDLCLGGSNSVMVNDMHTLQRTHKHLDISQLLLKIYKICVKRKSLI